MHFLFSLLKWRSLHVSSITCSSSGGASQTTLGTLRACYVSWLHQDRSGSIFPLQSNRNAPRIWRDFGSALPFQTRLTQSKPALPLPNEHGSQVKNQVRRQCCHTKHKKCPYQPTRVVSLLSGNGNIISLCPTLKCILANSMLDPWFYSSL
jgi:hypothetical protein